MSTAGTVLWVGSITADFQSERPLHPAAAAFLKDAFACGWADPTKIHQASRKTALLLNEAKELFASHLGIRADQVEFLSDPSLGFHLGVSGLMTAKSNYFYSGVDRSELFALAELHNGQRLGVSLNGETGYPSGGANDVLVWQTANGETGILAGAPLKYSGKVFVDATASGPLVPLPDHWHTALWNSRTWAGPAGLGIFAVANRSDWRNPLPHIDHGVSRFDFSIPLAITSAIALDNYVREYKEQQIKLVELNAKIRHFLLTQIGDVDIAGSLDSTLPHLLSFSLLYVDAALLVNELDARGIAVDSGSACNSANMEPSHVLAAMGLLTHGNLRMNLHLDTSEERVDHFLHTLKEIVAGIRS